MSAIFLSLMEIEASRKGTQLRELVGRLQHGGSELPFVSLSQERFTAVPGSVFAYWMSKEEEVAYRTCPPLEPGLGVARFGLSTKDDTRFLRAWWEVPQNQLTRDKRPPLAKGGPFARFYSDIHLVLDWRNEAAELKAALAAKYGGQHWSRDIRSPDLYFRPGMTWSRRSQVGLSVRALPAGCIFSDKGPAIFPDSEVDLSAALAVLNSAIFERLAGFQTAFGSFEVGAIQRTPVPASELPEELTSLGQNLFRLHRRRGESDEAARSFRSCPLVTELLEGGRLRSAIAACDAAAAARASEIAELQSRVNDVVAEAYRIAVSDASYEATASGQAGEEEEQDEVETELRSADERVADMFQWAFGAAFGRWDIRLVEDGVVPPLPESPSAELPKLPPAALAAGVDSAHASDLSGYPIRIPKNGILVDDPEHESDLIARVRQVLRHLYGDQADDIEREAVEILQSDGRTPRNLRDWFRNQKATQLGKNFFDFHIRHYTKSRRKAPLYWRLCTSPGRGQSDYGVWLYYPRLTNDTLWTVLNEYVGPKLALEEQRLEELRERLSVVEGADRREAESDIDSKQALLEELRWFESELRKVAERGYEPDLDDGVIINMAPLHAVIPWKEPEKIWKRLQKGEYDWSKLAMKYWPDRVRQKCSQDRSLAIAHGLAEES